MPKPLKPKAAKPELKKPKAAKPELNKPKPIKPGPMGPLGPPAATAAPAPQAPQAKPSLEGELDTRLDCFGSYSRKDRFCQRRCAIPIYCAMVKDDFGQFCGPDEPMLASDVLGRFEYE
jgi:hypothetical protein